MRPIDGDALEKKLRNAINMGTSINTSGLAELNAVLSDVETMPTIEPERKAGKWILKEHLYECDKCGCRISRFPFKGNIWNYYFCPNCGAKMEEGERE